MRERERERESEKEKCVFNENVNYYDVNSVGDFINET